MTRRLRAPDYVAGLAGLLLLAGAFAGEHQIVVRVLLVVAGVMAVALPLVTAVQDDPSLPVKWDVLTAWAALVGIIVAVITVLGETNWGDWAALAGTLLAFAGAWRAMREQSAPGLRTPPETRAMPTPPS